MEPAPQPQPLPEAKPFQKVVLFIGDTGVGKSKILNSVLNQGVSRKDLAGPAEVGNATTGTTERISYYYRQDLVLADTAGFFDRKISTPKVKQEFIDFVLRLNIGINHFYFVLKHGKIKVSDVPTFTLLEYMFGSKVYKQATLIVTHVDEQSYTLDQYLELNKDDAELRSFIDKFNGRVILGSFMSHAQPILDNVMAQTVREPFYRAIKADLDQCSSTKLEMRVINFNAFCQKLALLFGSVFGSPTEKRRLERLYEKERFKVHEHDSICLELVLNDIYITQCQHVFHFDCITAWIAQGKDTCPNCRQPLREFVCWRKSEGEDKEGSDQKKQ